MASAIFRLVGRAMKSSGKGSTDHEIQVNVVNAQALQRGLDALFDALMPWVVQLGSDPDLLTWDAGVLDSLANLVLVAVRQCGVDVAVTFLESDLDGIANFVGLRLPGAETDGWNLRARVEGEGLLCPVLCHFG